MTGIALGFGIGAGLAFLVACIKIERLQEETRFAKSASHATCVAFVMREVGAAHAVTVLESAAEAMASYDGQNDLRVLARDWGESDDPVPVQWLRQRAHRIEESLHD